MSSFTEQMSQELSCIDTISPTNAVNNATPYYSGGIDMSKFNRIMYEINIGAITGAGTLAAQLQSSASSTFASGVHNMTGGAITNVTNTSPNSVVTLETSADAVQTQNNGDRYVRLAVTIGANSVYYGASGFGGVATQEPASAQDPNTVLQRLVVT